MTTQKKLTIYISPEMKKQLLDIQKDTGVTLSEYIRRAIEEKIKRK